MGTSEKKLSLLRMIMESEDDSFISKMMNFGLSMRENNSSDWADDLPPHIMENLLKSIKEAENGKTIPHEVVIAEMKEKYPHLNF